MIEPRQAARLIHTPEDAEHLAGRYMHWLGFTDARVTPRGADGGIDVLASRAIAQVKFRSNLIGRPDLQRLFGARAHATGVDLFFFSHAGYTRQAREYADQVGMLLLEFDITGAVTPANHVAHRAHQSALARDRATRPPVLTSSTAPTATAQSRPRTTVEGTIRAAAITLGAIAALGALAWLVSPRIGELVFTLIAGAIAAAGIYATTRHPTRAPRTRLTEPRPGTAHSSTASTGSSGIACEYDHATAAIRRILVSTPQGTVVFTPSGSTHLTTLHGFTGYASPEVVRTARARAHTELVRLGVTPWL